jgi:tetratricopeptide (TPR) repeat protein
MAVSKYTKVRNDTPYPLNVQGADGRRLGLAPLEVRWLPSDDLFGFDLSQAKLTGLITESEEPPRELEDTIFSIAFGLGFLLVIACSVISGMVKDNSIAVPQWVIWVAGVIVWISGVVVVVSFKTRKAGLVVRFLWQMLTLLVILAIGLGLPAATVYYFGEGKVLLAQPPSAELFIRLLQVGFIAIASLLPTLLFFLFDRFRLSTVRDRLYRDLFRLDQRLETRSEIDASYGSQIQEAYGPEDQGRGRLAPGNRWPVLVCAIVVTAGWLAVLSPVGSVIGNPLVPRQTALAFSFIGAYFFGLQLIARSYARGDLKPKTYGYITIRILSVAVLSWILEVIFGSHSTTKLVTAFLTGILPEEFFTLLRERVRGKGPARLVPESEKHPLTRLEGIDLYDRARLELEGIVNIESLAHHELIQLVLATQVPVPRLVDWMDQAILYLHVTTESKSKDDVSAGITLRQYGIRTATDLLSCWDAAGKRKDCDDFKALLGTRGQLNRLEVIRDALVDDEWLDRIKDWRSNTPREPLEIHAYPNTYPSKLAYATRLEQERRYKEALQMIGEAIEIQDLPKARLQRAALLMSVPISTLRDPEAAREDARKAFDLGQDDLEILRELIPIHEEMKDWEYAIRATDAAIGLIGDPRDDDSRARLKALKKNRVEFERNQKAVSATAG